MGEDDTLTATAGTFTTAPFREPVDPLEHLIDAHWLYVSEFLKAHNEPEDTIAKIEFHYKSAFRHGYKHANEYTGILSVKINPTTGRMPGCDD